MYAKKIIVSAKSRLTLKYGKQFSKINKYKTTYYTFIRHIMGCLVKNVDGC